MNYYPYNSISASLGLVSTKCKFVRYYHSFKIIDEFWSTLFLSSSQPLQIPAPYTAYYKFNINPIQFYENILNIFYLIISVCIEITIMFISWKSNVHYYESFRTTKVWHFTLGNDALSILFHWCTLPTVNVNTDYFIGKLIISLYLFE